jgi:predicted CXXCH cytochrome family protein
MPLLGATIGLLLAASANPAFADPAECAICHAKTAETYRRTGMARSFYRVSAENTPDRATWYHAASERHFSIARDNDRYVMRRWQDGEDRNPVEKTIDYVLGSGNHARSYVSRAPDGRLLALPLAWYSERGGFWAMAPGYDRPDHADFRREIGFDCMFCHNGYPEMPPGADGFGKPALFRGRIPEGIDCQRCHGPGSAHIAAARIGATRERIRSGIVNPRRLSAERQLDVCLQCHLQSTSRRLPFAIRRYDRGAFSYRPGEPLSDYMLHFELAPEANRTRTFEVVSAGSRFLESPCYKGSAGKLTCTKCHNPHDVPRGPAAVSHYAAVCRQCHQAPRHTRMVKDDCTACHMPKRRTDDAVHVVMTDHLIRREPPPGDPLTPKQEVHERDGNTRLGPVVPLHPRTLSGADALYLGVAQVRESANLAEGISRLQTALSMLKPREPGFYYDLAEALRNSGKPRQAVSYYEQAQHFVPALRGLGTAYQAAGDSQRAIAAFEKAVSVDPADVETLNALGAAYNDDGEPVKAIATLRQAIAANPDQPEPHLNLGAALAAAGDLDGAMAALRDAIRLRPDLAAAHNNLALLLDRQGRSDLAARHFLRAVRLDPDYAAARHNYGLHLAKRADWQGAREQLEAAVKLERSAAAHANFATVLAKAGDTTGAIEHYERALQIDKAFEPARLNLARTLISASRGNEAVPHLHALEASSAPEIRAAAAELLRLTGKPRR